MCKVQVEVTLKEIFIKKISYENYNVINYIKTFELIKCFYLKYIIIIGIVYLHIVFVNIWVLV